MFRCIPIAFIYSICLNNNFNKDAFDKRNETSYLERIFLYLSNAEKIFLGVSSLSAIV